MEQDILGRSDNIGARSDNVCDRSTPTLTMSTVSPPGRIGRAFLDGHISDSDSLMSRLVAETHWDLAQIAEEGRNVLEVNRFVRNACNVSCVTFSRTQPSTIVIHLAIKNTG
jgi:hypothetical protein